MKNPRYPSRWKTTTLRALFTENTKKNINLSSMDAYQFKYGSIIKKPQFEVTEALVETYKKYTLIDPDDIMINGLNLNYDFVTQRVGLVREHGIITSAYISIRPRESTNAKYYYYLLKSLDDKKVFNGMGTGIRLTLSYKCIKNLILPSPNSEEQRQIVNYLDWQTSQINKLINAKKHQITLLEERRRSFAFYATTTGINSDVQLEKSEIYWLKKAPKHWTSINLARLFVQVKNKNNGMQENNLLSLSYGNIVRRDINATEGLLPENFEGYNIIEPNDIVLRLTDLQNDQKSLRTGITRERGIVTSAYLTIRNTSENNPEYLHFVLHAFDLIKGFYNFGASGVRQGLNWDDLKTLRVPLPPVTEQNLIVDAIKKEYLLTDSAITSIKKEIEVLAEYQSRIIFDVVTGQIDIRNVEIPIYDKVEEVVEDSSAANEELDSSEVE